MKPLIVLLIAFGICLLFFYWKDSSLEMWEWSKAGCIAMGSMLFFTGVAHFKPGSGMEKMLPVFFPFKKSLILITGMLEIAAAIGLFLPHWQATTGWWVIAFFVMILPANISAALRHIHPLKGTPNGPGPAYLWFRVPLQFFFIAWVYFFAIRLA